MTLILFAGIVLNAQNQATPKRIAFSKAGPDEKYQLYINWLKAVNPDYDYVDLNGLPVGEALKEFVTCQGLVVTGGQDVHPSMYGKAADAGRCGPFDQKRDAVDISLIKAALERKVPIFAICRGAQIMNVTQGGGLIIDIDQDYHSLIEHRLASAEGASHDINVDKRYYLYQLTKLEKGKVNSFHHQAVDRLAPVFVSWAKAPDGIIEAFGWKEPAGKSFLIAVQWHPERMMKDEPFSKLLAQKFLEAVGEMK
jgi:putative glutamine amidotransferase